MNNKNLKQNEGMPEVAEVFSTNKTIILVMVTVIIFAFLGMYISTKGKSKKSAHVDETYSVQNEQYNENKIAPVKTETPVPTKTSITHEKITSEQLAFIREKQNELRERLSSPLMIVNNASSEAKLAENHVAEFLSKPNNANTQFLKQVATEKYKAVDATTIAPLNSIIAEGNYLHAILESATNSDLPGSLRAIISEPAYSEDGSQVLVPQGTRLIGQYKSGMLQGQSRIFIVWTRLITPSGISVSLGSPGVDSIGVSGMGADEIDHHFWARFGTASLLSIIGAGASNENLGSESSVSNYRSAIANSFAQAADQSLQQQGNIPPTLMSYQGKPIMVFVAHDLNFQTALRQIKHKANLF